jgi:cytochrome c biogenesis protein
VISTCCASAATRPKLATTTSFENVQRKASRPAFGRLAENAGTGAASGTSPDSGWKVKLQQRSGTDDTGYRWLMVAHGSTTKAIAAHSAIVLVCIGGLLDGDMIVKAQMWLNGKTTYTGGGLIANVPAQHRGSVTATRRSRQLAGGRSWGQSSTALLEPAGQAARELPFPSS